MVLRTFVIRDAVDLKDGNGGRDLLRISSDLIEDSVLLGRIRLVSISKINIFIFFITWS